MTPEFTPPFNSREQAVHLSATGTLHGAFLPFSVNRCLIDLLLSGCGCPSVFPQEQIKDAGVSEPGN